MSLDWSPREFRALLHHTSDAVADLYEDLPRAKVFHGRSVEEVRSTFEEALPPGPTEPETVIRRLMTEFVPSGTLDISPDFYGYVVSAGNQMAVAAALVQAAANFCGSKWDLSAGSAEIERTVIRWISEFIGVPADGGGVLTTGGTSANLVSLAVARRFARKTAAREGLFGGNRMMVYASEEVHSCFASNLDLLGIGSEQLRSIPSDARFRMDCEALEREVIRDRSEGRHPFCVIGNGGSTNTGSVDDLQRMAGICARHALWFHVDAAYGGPAALTPSVGDAFRGLDLADSIALDPHKWLYAPLECGCALFRDPDVLEATFKFEPDYLKRTHDGGPSERIDWYGRTYQTTRDTKAIRIWATFLAYGADRIREEIDGNIRSMRYLGDRVAASADFELLAPVALSTVCFRYRPRWAGEDPEALDRVNRDLLAAIEADGRLFLPGTRVRGRVALRATTVNHRHDQARADRLFAIVSALAGSLVPDCGRQLS